MLQTCQSMLETTAPEARNGARSKFWAAEFAKQPEDVRADFNARAAAAVAAAKLERDELYKKTCEKLAPLEAQQ